MAKKISHDERAHATFSPSSAHRWLECPASIRLSEGAPDTESEAAKEGTIAHEFLEKLLLEYDMDMEDDLFTAEAIEATLPDEYAYMADALSVAMEYIHHVNHQFAEHDTYDAVESKIDLTHLGGDCWGHLDYAIWSPTFGIEIMDFKFGHHPVEVDHNAQLLTYMVGMCEELGYDFPQFNCTIIQPRAAHLKGPVRTAILKKTELRLFKGKLEAGIARQKDKVIQYSSGPWCQYCKGAGRCPEITTQAQTLARTEFADFKPVPPAHLDNATLAYIIENAAAFESWIAQAKAEAIDRLSKGQTLMDTKLVYNATRSTIDDALYDKWAEIYLDEEDRYRSKPHNLTELRKIMKNYEYDEDVERILQRVLKTSTPSVTVASTKDGRAEYVPAALEFKKKK